MNPAEEYIFNQPEPYKSIMLNLQLLIEHTFPKMVMKYKWRIPCFYLDNRPICFLNQSKDYVDVAFWHASHVVKHAGQLVSENRKKIKSLRYRSVEDIDDAVFINVLREVEYIKNTSFLK
ncbi:DUF1801 domain-containing protein [Subsaxibacter sp. CAU 1640]|uniref:DUF1801 domain-containing protein n=1 Tax=Subsaxibacter sp. CAU 1640 TaxID=2933271 RepID=UPI0020042CB6|nr:DUF1801 domain-containing protein [Subsaxibacter sp. CAU 1640]MCK7591494.1 DUF1801 domain-containing protein [Subsaxibacter sp. CAU 1640]